MSASTASRAAMAKEMWWERNNPQNMKTITSVQQFVDELVSRESIVDAVLAPKTSHLLSEKVLPILPLVRTCSDGI